MLGRVKGMCKGTEARGKMWKGASEPGWSFVRAELDEMSLERSVGAASFIGQEEDVKGGVQ